MAYRPLGRKKTARNSVKQKTGLGAGFFDAVGDQIT
jgi:hypothetical protein